MGNETSPQVEADFGLGAPDATDSLGFESASLSLDGMDRDNSVRRRGLDLV